MSRAVLVAREDPAPALRVAVYLAGVAGVGKSTAGRIVAKMLSLPFYEVEARECWRQPPGPTRQECFLQRFLDLMGQGVGVYSNHVLAVYGYSAALLGPDDPVTVRARWYSESLRDGVVVLYVDDKEVLWERIRRRMVRDEERGDNVVEKMLDVHLRAQEFILDFAEHHAIPTINTTRMTPEEVAYAILEVGDE